MRWSPRTYAAYSIGCAAVWAIILTAVATTAGNGKLRTFLRVFLGWVIGGLSATIARSVYPPP